MKPLLNVNRRSFLRVLGLGAMVAALPPLPTPVPSPAVAGAVTVPLVDIWYKGIPIFPDTYAPPASVFFLNTDYFDARPSSPSSSGSRARPARSRTRPSAMRGAKRGAPIAAKAGR